MRWIYISPHFDDTVLSCGGLIWEQAQQGIPVEIWTICAGDAEPGELSMLAKLCHFQWGFESAQQVVAARTQENQQAAERVGAECVNFSIPDCIYRRDPGGELLYTEDVFVEPVSAEAGLPSEIAAALGSELQPGDVLVSPLAIGDHVDHVLARRAVELLTRPCWYYADIPYYLKEPRKLAAHAKGLAEFNLFPVSASGLEAWQNGVAAYASQMVMLYETVEKMKASLAKYWKREHGIRLRR